VDNLTRQVYSSLAELLDRLAIDQIKEILDPVNRVSCAEELGRLEYALDLIFAEGKLKLDARFIWIVIALAQINLHIWRIKETMQTEPARFQECMRLAHQLNGIRNRIKNKIADEAGIDGQSAKKTNLETDSLEGWAMTVLGPRQTLR